MCVGAHAVRLRKPFAFHDRPIAEQSSEVFAARGQKISGRICRTSVDLGHSETPTQM